MSGTHIDPDRLADAAREAAWSAAESAHLTGCAECRLELAIVAAAGRLGLAETANLPPGRIAKAVLDRLATAPEESAAHAPHSARWLAGLAVAAALVFAVWYGSARVSAAPDPTESTPVLLSVLHELDGLDEPELEDVLESIPPAAGAVSHLDPVRFVELNVNDLERLLRSMEE